MSRGWLLWVGLLLAAPWVIFLIAGWEADLEAISGGAPSPEAALRAGLFIVARLVAVLVAPVFLLGAGWRLLLERVAGWTAAPSSHTLS